MPWPKAPAGFEIFNTNDFLQGLQKVAKEMNEYYNLGYAPPNQIARRQLP